MGEGGGSISLPTIKATGMAVSAVVKMLMQGEVVVVVGGGGGMEPLLPCWLSLAPPRSQPSPAELHGMQVELSKINLYLYTGSLRRCALECLCLILHQMRVMFSCNWLF